MGALELLALSLGLSVATAAVAWTGGRLLETLSSDPLLRDRMWGTALVLPALPPLAIGLLLLTPAPVREIALSAPTLAGPAAAGPISDAPAAAVEAIPMLDAGLIAAAVLALAALLFLARLSLVLLRLFRLTRLLRTVADADVVTVGMIGDAARALSTPVPRTGVSKAAPEPLLVGLKRPRLILPAGLTATADPAVAQAVIAHELVHLKRGDHRALWLEEALLTVLAINPLMPVLRARRAAAREEACDEVALAGAALSTRRAYAESLIEALRSRAGPRPMLALTFTGAGRKTAMHRLKAILTPAAPAGRQFRLLAAGVAATIAAAAGAGSLAVAGEREVIVRTSAPPEVGVSQADNPAPQASPRTDARQEAAAAFAGLTPEQQARFRDPTAAEYRALCASGDPADGGFCAGVIFSQLPRGADGAGDICLPADLEAGDEDARRAALGALVERTKAEIAGAAVRPGDAPTDVARAALVRAYPCDAAEAFRATAARLDRDFLPLSVSLDIEGRPLSVQGDETLRVVLTDENGAVMNTHGTLNSGSGQASGPLGPLGMTIAAADFPGIGQAARTFTLTGEIRGPGRVLRYFAEPVTLRLAPGARRADLRPTLSFRPA
jgi:beta-lactamase regulating signal transducer with metallopeptidase domain